MSKTFKWVVEFEVSETWVEDGFDMTDERAHMMIQKDLAYAYPSETSAKVIKAPKRADILRMQGYSEEAIALDAKN